MDKGGRRRAAGVQVQARQNMEERLKTMEEINNKNILKMQQSHRIQAKVYEKMLSEQELFWKGQLAEKEDQMRQMETDIDEWRNRELLLVGEMEALEQRAMEGTTTLSQNFMEAYQQLCDAMHSLQRVKVSIEDKKKKKERRHRKEKEREERHQRSRPSEEEEESEGDCALQENSLHFKPGGGGYGGRMPGSSVDHDWRRQVAQLDGKWFQIKDIMEAMREEMEQRSMLGSAAVRQSFGEAYEHLVDCMNLMESVKRELEEQARRRRKEQKHQGPPDCFWKRWSVRIKTAMGIGSQTATQIAGHVGAAGVAAGDQVAHWTSMAAAGAGGLRGPGAWGHQTPTRGRSSPRHPSSPAAAGGRGGGGRRSPVPRLGHSMSRQQQRDDV